MVQLQVPAPSTPPAQPAVARPAQPAPPPFPKELVPLGERLIDTIGRASEVQQRGRRHSEVHSLRLLVAWFLGLVGLIGAGGVVCAGKFELLAGIIGCVAAPMIALTVRGEREDRDNRDDRPTGNR